MSERSAPDAIVIELDVPVEVALAWRAVTDPGVVAQWFADVTPIDAVGRPYRVDFGDGSAVEGQVMDHEPGRQLAYSWRWADAPDGPTTVVRWVVEATDGVSRIRLTHDGWTAADTVARDDHAEYWDSYLEALADFLQQPGAG